MNVNDAAKKNALDFLLYSYFGITIDDKWNSILKVAIEKAYKDATMRGAFNARKRAEDGEKISEAKKNGIVKLTDGINSLLGQASCQYDEWHKKMCKDIVGLFQDIKEKNKDVPAFTYGNAQKWVNMTMKNLYVIAPCFVDYYGINGNNESAKLWKVLSLSSCFHIPLDNYILSALYNNYVELNYSANKGKNKDENKNILICETDKKQMQYKIKFGNEFYGWSQIPTYEYYLDFRKMLEGQIKQKNPNITLIEWESNNWIEQKKKSV